MTSIPSSAPGGGALCGCAAIGDGFDFRRMTMRPNILWVVTTQWRAQACGYAGDPNAATPHLDALARTSVRFPHAVTPHPFGPFARAALLTGLPSPANGVADYFDPLPLEARTIAHALAERGYDTAFFGKWHLARRDPAAPLVGEAHARTLVPPEARGGFAFWEGFEGGFLLNDPWLHGTRLPEPVRFRGYQSEVVADRAIGWWGSAAARPPWFCVVSLEPPHPPYGDDAAGIRPPDARELVLRPNVPPREDVTARARAELAGYYAHIHATDRALGRILQSLRENGVLERTAVVFTSVHGDMHGSHGLFRKGWPHEESVGVPLLVRLPGSAAPRADPAAVSLLDLPGSALALAEGRAWAPTAAHATISMPSVVPLPHQCDRRWRGVRTSRRKLVVHDDGSPGLFFDLEADPWERENLASDPARAEERRALAALLD